MKVVTGYINGNYIVKRLSYCQFPAMIKTALRVDEELCPAFPDSIDIKISNKCKWGCKFCHESSVPDGNILDVNKTINILSQLPEDTGIELAIGGGNILESIDEITPFINWAKEYGFLLRCTLNYRDVLTLSEREKEFLKNFSGIGISVDRLAEDVYLALKAWNISNRRAPNSFRIRLTDLNCPKKIDLYVHPRDKFRMSGDINSFGSIVDEYDKNIVFHVIAGIIPPEHLRELILSENPILVLGYKQWGRAINDTLPDMTETKQVIKEILDVRPWAVLGFDNLALDQLGIRDMISKDKMENIYLGDEGTCSMYIDAVKGEYAKTSRSKERVSWDNIGLIDFFKDDSIAV